MLVYPKPGVLVRDPDKRDLLPEDGRDVDGSNPYWIRRLADEDVTPDVPASPASTSPARLSGKGGSQATSDPANGSNNA